MQSSTRSKRFMAACAAVAVASAISLGGLVSASAESTPTPKKEAVFTVGVNYDVDSANPYIGRTGQVHFYMEYPTLTYLAAKDYAPSPGLATSWKESKDRMSWTFELRPGMKWSDGEPMTAEDAAYSFNRVINGAVEKGNFGAAVARVEKAEATSATKLVLTMKTPSDMSYVKLPIVPEHIWKDVSEDQLQAYKNTPTLEKPVVGGGPYLMAEMATGQYFTMVRNPNFYGKTPGFDKIVFRIFANQETMGQALKKGEIDFVDRIDANVYQSLKGVPGITTWSAANPVFDYVAVNTGAALADGTPIGDGNPLLKDRVIRQAIDLAIDKQTMVNKLLGTENGTVASTAIPALYPNMHLDPANARSYDPKKANKLLDDAGYKMGPDNVRVTADGKQLSFRLFGLSGLNFVKTLDYIKGYLAEIGIKTDVQGLPPATLLPAIGQGNYDLVEWSNAATPNPTSLLAGLTCARRSHVVAGTVSYGGSDSFYCNPKYDTLFAKQDSESNADARAKIVKEMQQIVYDDAPWVLLYSANNLEVYRSDRVTGFQPQPAPNGVLLYQAGSNASYENIAPVTAETNNSNNNNNPWSNPALIIGLILGLVVVVGIVTVIVRRRSSAADDRE